VTDEVQEKRYSPNGKKIATEIVEAGEWYDAEDYHQRYLENNPSGCVPFPSELSCPPLTL
jgi:peptide-methionine (S)-S-oxide reductase